MPTPARQKPTTPKFRADLFAIFVSVLVTGALAAQVALIVVLS